MLAFVAVLSPDYIMAGGAPRHVIMISIDGLRPEIYLDPVQVGISVPNLVQLSRQGSRAERMIPVFPSVTYPGHATLVTGVYPATHGVIANYKPDGEWYLHSSDIRAETLWQSAQRKDLAVAIVTWPASYGARVAYLIPENLAAGVSDMAPLIHSGSTPGLFERLEEQSGKVTIPPIENDDGAEQLDRMTARFAADILRRYKPDLLLIHFLNADHQQHSHGPASAEALLAFEAIDRQIGEVMQASHDAGIGAETTFVIVGDHGFLPVHTNINVNGLLVDIGFAEVTNDGSVKSTEVAALPFGGGAAFYLKHQHDGELADRLADAVNAELQGHYSGRVAFISRDELNGLNASRSNQAR